MWYKWFPWRFIVRNAAKRHGFLDPLELISRLQNFAQPAEVAAPWELLRAGVVFHARGLLNSQAIQHNLDWIWPYWVERQFDPRSDSFVPRAFSLTHVNLTHRNWTAVGLPGTERWPIVDPRGLVTPFLDGWSIDCWIIPDSGPALFPSRAAAVSQELLLDDRLDIRTNVSGPETSLTSTVAMTYDAATGLNCRLSVSGISSVPARLAVVLRPYNPEGISFIQDISLLSDRAGWVVNRSQRVFLDRAPERNLMSRYQRGDVFRFFRSADNPEVNRRTHIDCPVGMASAAALFALRPGSGTEITVTVPLSSPAVSPERMVPSGWRQCLEPGCRLVIADRKMKFLYDAAVRTLILHSPHDVFPGPYTYRRFWFRDAAFILQALLALGFPQRVKQVLDRFPGRQTPMGYFLSQEGEWDANGEALWILRQYGVVTGVPPDPQWKNAVVNGAKWIIRKRLSSRLRYPHAGLFPAGFSAEHLGPNDYYYWDDFWGVAGLDAAAEMLEQFGEEKLSGRCRRQSRDFMQCIERSFAHTEKSIRRPAIPAAPYRRMDAGAIGSLVAGYPLRLLSPDDPRLLDTVNFLWAHCRVRGGFFQDMTHSGVNPYLSLHIAQVLLRAADPRWFPLIAAVADLASPTGQWPEAVHPRTLGGCMGDGQHVWAAAEWVMMLRNCFVREEDTGVIVASGIPVQWLDMNQVMSLGPTLTRFGPITVTISPNGPTVQVSWQAQWRGRPPEITVRLPGCRPQTVADGRCRVSVSRQDDQ